MRTALKFDRAAPYAGVYEVHEQLGAGGTGTVYRARHVWLEQERALKILHPATLDDSRQQGRLRLEASVFGRLNGEPSLVMPFDMGFDAPSQTHFLAMELLEGCDLATWVHEFGPLDVATTLALMRQVARGIDAAHAYVNPHGIKAPIVHRDLTPSNLFLIRPHQGIEQVKILDFGLADMLGDEDCRVSRRSGTPMYRSYEQERGLRVVPQTDVWALGLVVHFALTGSAYWESRTAAELHDEVTVRPLELASVRLRRRFERVELPPAFDGWLLQCLSRLPTRRFASAGEAIDELELSLAEAPRERPLVLRGGELASAGRAAFAPVMPSDWQRSRTVSRVETEQVYTCPPFEGALQDYAAEVHPMLKDVVRLADDLMTATGHYLAFAPESRAALQRQLEGVAHAAGAYNRASQRVREPIGSGVFAAGLDNAPALELGEVMDEVWPALLGLPTSCDVAAPEAPLDVVSEFCIHSTHWQTQRVGLHAALELAKRALTRAEDFVEQRLSSEPVSLAPAIEALSVTRSLVADYSQRAQALASAVAEWLDATAQLPSEGSEVQRRAWQLARPIEAMNQSYVQLESRSLALRVQLLARGGFEGLRLAEALKEIQAFQWYRVRPQLNAVLVHLIRLIVSEDHRQPMRLVLVDRPAWERLRRLLARASFSG